MKTEVSVLMSCYNANKWLGEAIESVLQQTYKGFEFILVDDGSTDNTLEIIRNYGDKDKRIKIITKPNTGLTDSLNVGIFQAKGNWIARLDADDICLPDRLETQVSFMRNNAEVVLLGSGCVEIDERGCFAKEHRYPERHDALVKNLERSKKFFPHSASFYRTKTIKKIGQYRNNLNGAEDKDLWLRLSEIGKIVCLPQVLVKLRKHENSISYGTSDMLGIAATVCHFLRKNKVSDPSSLDKQTWEYFLSWLTFRLDEKKVFETSASWQELRENWYSIPSASIISKGKRLITNLVKSGNAGNILKQRLFNQNLPVILAEEWIHNHNNGDRG